jgi:hypothetical protein
MAGKNTSAAWVCKRVTVCSAHFRNQLYHLSPRTTAPRLREAFDPVWPNAWVPCSQCDTTPTPCRPRSRVSLSFPRPASCRGQRPSGLARHGPVGRDPSSKIDLPGPDIVRRIRPLVLVLHLGPAVSSRPTPGSVPLCRCLFPCNALDHQIRDTSDTSGTYSALGFAPGIRPAAAFCAPCSAFDRQFRAAHASLGCVQRI